MVCKSGLTLWIWDEIVERPNIVNACGLGSVHQVKSIMAEWTLKTRILDHTFLIFEFWNLFDIYYDKLKINLISFYFFPNWLPVIPPLLPHKTSASIQLCWKWKKLQFSFSNDWYPLLYTLKYNCELYSLNFPSIKCRTYVVYALANRDISLLWREGWTIGMK